MWVPQQIQDCMRNKRVEFFSRCNPPPPPTHAAFAVGRLRLCPGAVKGRRALCARQPSMRTTLGNAHILHPHVPWHPALPPAVRLCTTNHPLGIRVFNLGGGGMSIEPPKTGGKGSGKRAQLTGPLIIYNELLRQRCRKFFCALKTVNFFSPNLWQMMLFLNPLHALIPKIPFSFFADFWVWVTFETWGSVSVGFWRSRQLSPFGGGSSQGALSIPPPFQLKARLPLCALCKPTPPGSEGLLSVAAVVGCRQTSVTTTETGLGRWRMRPHVPIGRGMEGVCEVVREHHPH